MSVRRSNPAQDATKMKLQSELNALKATAQEANRADNLSASVRDDTANTPSFDQLVPVEQAAASLGVHPDAWKPIGFLNNAHYDSLLKQNALDDDLARRIEAYKVVAGTSD